jgi:hypothetical protein
LAKWRLSAAPAGNNLFRGYARPVDWPTIWGGIMQIKWVSVGVGVILLGAVASVPSVMAGPSMSSAWLAITIDQDECIKRGSQAVRDNSFNTRFEVLGNSSIYGERGDYTSLVRCAADKNIVYFVVAGAKGDICSKHMNAIRDGF